MKTYEEMAQSVICRAKAHKTVRNRIIAGSVAAVLALCVCVGAMGDRAQNPTVQEPATHTIKMEPRVTFLYAQGNTTAELKREVKLPSCCELRVVDVSGMTDEEIKAIALEEQQYADALVANYPEDKGHGWMQYSSDGYPSISNDHLVATFIHSGSFILKVQDWSLVESVEATTKNSVLILPGLSGTEDIDPFAYPQSRHYRMNKEELNEASKEYYGGLGFYMGLGSGVVWYLNDHPVPLSQLSETFTFTFQFTDGTQETHTMDMIFEDDGQIYTLYRGTEAVA